MKGTLDKTSLVIMVLLTLPGALSAQSGPFPDIIPLPNGFRPEGVTLGLGNEIFVGSLADGSLYRADLASGHGEIVVPPQSGRIAVGLAFDQRSGLLFVAGGPAGFGYVYDSATGEATADYQLTTAAEPFINDVVITNDGAYFTDSFQPVLYRVPLRPNGVLPDQSAVETIPLSGDYVFVPGAFNANGIESTASGNWLVIVHSALGELYRVDPNSGNATLIDLAGDSVPNGDGLVLGGRTLYVVQNRLNQVAVISLDPDLSHGTVESFITSPSFDIPTTAASFGNALYAVNARFGTPPTPETEYEIVRVFK